MPSTFSIENINLNGSVLTARDGRLFINDEQVKNTSGIQLTERFFIKGYAPVSFYSRWATIGNYLNETFFNDFFMVTGMLISCATPATGSVALAGRFYARKPNSIIDTETISYFTLPTRTVYVSEPLHYKLKPNNIIGLDIYQAPNELKSISLNLLGYSPAAGHFDKMPNSITFYEREYVQTGFEFEEKYNQYDGIYTGIKILSRNSGLQTIQKDFITGYVSGILEKEADYSILHGENSSGYIIDGNKYFFGTGSQFNQFNNITNFFNPVSGYLWNGFQITADQNYFYSGYENERYGSGEIFEPIGQRTIPVQELITGFISGYKASGQPFIPLNRISGFAGDERIGNLPLTSGSSGYLIGGSGFYFGGSKYSFNTGNKFSGFLQFPSIFTQELGYQYYPIATNPDYLFTNYFTGIYPDGSGGYTGEMIGYIGYRYVPSGQTISGFIKVQADYKFNPLQVTSINEISGISGYYIGTGIFRFLTGNKFSGFDGQSGFNQDLGYQFDGFNQNTFSSFSGNGQSVILQKTITGFVSGYLNEFNQFQIYTGLGRNSGYIIDGIKYHFNLPSYFLSGEPIIGYISGYMNEFGQFTGFNISNPAIASSGYFINSTKFEFPKGGQFNEFNYMPGFDINYGYSYSGFSFNFGSGFVGTNYSNSGTGSITGYIGSRNILINTGIFTGINNSMFGFTDNLGFQYIVNQNTFQYDNVNYIPNNPELSFGPGIITGNIGYKNISGIDFSFGTGVMKSIIGYRNLFNFAPLTGNFYYKNDDGSKIIGPGFNLPIGDASKKFDLSNKVFAVPADKFIGLDLNRTLSGLYGLSVALFGYYE